MGGYRRLIEIFIHRVRSFWILSTAMRYAGPREAIFHASFGGITVARILWLVVTMPVSATSTGNTRRMSWSAALTANLELMSCYCMDHFIAAAATESSRNRLVVHYEGAPELVREISGTDIRRS